MDINVQKYGGSSLATEQQIRSVADRVAHSHRGGAATAVVVSARGSTTDDLIRSAHAVSGVPCSREADKLLATGELASAALLTIALQERGVPSVSLSGPEAGMRAEGRHGAGLVTAVDPGPVRGVLERGHVAVIAGFQAQGPGGEVVTLGRGGSDTSAVALAVTHGALACEIFTDVEGVHRADPRLVHGAGVLPAVDSALVIEMAASGARVMHPRAVELAASHATDIVVRHSAGRGAGTTIVGRSEMSHTPMTLEGSAHITALTHELATAQVVIRAARRSPQLRISEVEVLGALADRRIPVDSVNWWSPSRGDVQMSFCVPAAELDEAYGALEQIVSARGGAVEARASLGRVSIVGTGLFTDTGITVSAINELAANHIATEGVSCSPLRISLLVREDRVRDAVIALYRKFGLETDEQGAELAVA